VAAEREKSRVRQRMCKQNCQKRQQQFYIIKIMTLMPDEGGMAGVYEWIPLLSQEIDEGNNNRNK